MAQKQRPMPITQFCGMCRQRRPIKGFSIKSGRCKECRAIRRQALAQISPPAKKKMKKTTRTTPDASRCPSCLVLVGIVGRSPALAEHHDARGNICLGSGRGLPRSSGDALDHRLPGSFGGRNA